MPTGTGKTGIIACLTRLSNSGSSLVLAPWANLREEMARDLDTGFWRVVGVQPGVPKVVKILPSNAKKVLSAKSRN
jgi:superfamily II DNA or RNA helicase